MDADLPSQAECRLFKSTFGKLIWVFLQPCFYGLRPLITKPKPVGWEEILNWVVVGSFDFFVYKYLGGKALIYLFAGSILGLGWHPMSGHFIAEHYEFIEGQETYSYYGGLNKLAYNVGFHNEHHDFPRCRGRLLPLVKEACRTGGEIRVKEEYRWDQELKSDPIGFFKTVFSMGIPDFEVVNREG